MPGLGSGRGARARSRGGRFGHGGAVWKPALAGEARLLHVQRRGRSPDHAGKPAGRAGQARVVGLVEAGEHEQLQAAGLDQQGGGDAVAAQRLLDGRGRAAAASVTQKVRSSPVGSTSTSATASAASGPQAARQGRAANTFSFGSASRRPHQALSGVSAQHGDAAQGAGGGQRVLGLGDLAQRRGGAEAQAGELHGAAGVLAAPDGRGGTGPAAPGCRRSARARCARPATGEAPPRGSASSLRSSCASRPGAGRSVPASPAGGLGGGHRAGQARALVDQAQQLGVDGVDPRADLLQRRRRSAWAWPRPFSPPKPKDRDLSHCGERRNRPARRNIVARETTNRPRRARRPDQAAVVSAAAMSSACCRAASRCSGFIGFSTTPFMPAAR